SGTQHGAVHVKQPTPKRSEKHEKHRVHCHFPQFWPAADPPDAGSTRCAALPTPGCARFVNKLLLVWLWFRSPHHSCRAFVMRTSEPSHTRPVTPASVLSIPKFANESAANDAN